jgi:voltage-gated potassium channel Kch
MKEIKLVKWLRYNFDNLMSKGTMAPLVLLFILSILIVLFLSTVAFLTNMIPDSNVHINGVADGEKISYIKLVYITFLRMLDPGVVSGDPTSHGFIIFMLLATFAGLILISVLIAIINTGVINRINNLRKGKSFVLESNHTILLGWSFQVFPVIKELVIANENRKNPVIAILADKDKVFMEDEIRSKVGDTGNTRIVCRTGNPIDIHDLNIINLNEARSIIITAPDSYDPDSNVIKTILAITNNPHRKPEPEKYHIVAEIRDPRNVVIAEIAGRDEVQLVIFDYLISRITAQTCRQPGLSVVFNELLDFDGDEIYFKDIPALYGKTFVEAMFSFETSTLIGIRKSNGEIIMKPEMNSIIGNGDKLIAISENYETVKLSGITEFFIDPHAIIKNPPIIEPSPESTLIIGWNRRAPMIINELDNYVFRGSKVTVLADHEHAQKELTLQCSHLVNQTIKFWEGDTTNRRILDDLNVYTYNHIIVLSESNHEEDVQSTDARTLSTLLHLRDIADKSGIDFSIVSEMLDDRNRELAEVTNTDDFIVSVKLDSLMLSQISENKELKIIFEMLFSAGGPQIYLKPAENYVELDKPVNFYTIMESARQKGQIAIGFKLQNMETKYSGENKLGHGVFVNPVKSKNTFFTKGDKIIIISEDENVG